MRIMPDSYLSQYWDDLSEYRLNRDQYCTVLAMTIGVLYGVLGECEINAQQRAILEALPTSIIPSLTDQQRKIVLVHKEGRYA